MVRGPGGEGSCVKLNEFLERFSGGFRRKHINSPIDTVWAKTSRNKRLHFLAGKAEIPQEFKIGRAHV